MLSSSDHPGIIHRSLAANEPDPSVFSQSEKPAETQKKVQTPSEPQAETTPEPGSAQIDGSLAETQNSSDPHTSKAAANREQDESQTGLWDSVALENNDDPRSLEPARNSRTSPEVSRRSR